MKYHCVILMIVQLFGVDLAYSDEPPIPEGRRIREIIQEKYPAGNVHVGGTTGWKKIETSSGLVLDREFSYATPENDFKQVVIHPAPGVWNWKFADAWVKHCEDNKQLLRLHGPISPQCSKWTKDDKRTADELQQNLEEFMTELCKRYDKYEHVKWLDVVNETVLSNGEWFGPKEGDQMWENPWAKIGFDETYATKPPLYIKMAFQIANQHAPNTKLIINQHGEMEEVMWDKVKSLVPYLREQGLRVDGIGWQAHITTGWEKQPGNMEKLHALIAWAHENKLSFHVTEMNAWVKDKEKDWDAQAATFSAILGALLEHRDSGVVTWNVWSISDIEAWYNEVHWEGCLFDRQHKAKAAYYALQKILENPPASKNSQKR